MGTMDRRPASVPPPPPAVDPAVLEELARVTHGERPRGTSSARRAPAPRATGLTEVLLRPVPLPRWPPSWLRRLLPGRGAGAHGGRGDRRQPEGVRRPWWSMPTFGRLAAPILRLLPQRLRRGASQAARAARCRPGAAAWLLLFALVGLTVVGPRSIDPRPNLSQGRYRAALQTRGHDAVRASAAEIGLRRTVIPTVRATHEQEWIGGYFAPASFTIAFNSRHEFADAFLLAVAAHESVHALFDQYGLKSAHEGPDGFFQLLVEETTAEVLGAHIAGRAWSRRGGKGDKLTAALLDSHRRDCDPHRPGSVANHYFVKRREGGEAFSDLPREEALSHFGPPALVDAVAQICERERLPLDAARAVAARFMRPRLATADRPIREEFDLRYTALMK